MLLPPPLLNGGCRSQALSISNILLLRARSMSPTLLHFPRAGRRALPQREASKLSIRIRLFRVLKLSRHANLGRLQRLFSAHLYYLTTRPQLQLNADLSSTLDLKITCTAAQLTAQHRPDLQGPPRIQCLTLRPPLCLRHEARARDSMASRLSTDRRPVVDFGDLNPSA